MKKAKPPTTPDGAHVRRTFKGLDTGKVKVPGGSCRLIIGEITVTTTPPRRPGKSA